MPTLKTLIRSGTLVTLILPLMACLSSADTRKVSAKEAHQLLQAKKIVLVDVREADELADGGTAQGALWLPTSKQAEDSPEMKAFLEQVAPGGVKDKEIVFFCRSGGRAGRTADSFQKKGFKVANMGGFSSWQEAGLPTQPKP